MPNEWYKQASANKAPLDFPFTVRMGSFWLRCRDDYVRAVREQEIVLERMKNHQAARVLRYHRQSLPKGLPYHVVVTGFEWPLLARAFHRAMRHDSPTYRKQLQNLYKRFGAAKREAGERLKHPTAKMRTRRMKDDTRAALAAMSAEEIFTMVQVANSDELFMNAMTDAQKDAVIKASIEAASKTQEDTGNWPTFEEWLKCRSELIHAELKRGVP